jgi:hypothetical protein
MKKIQPLVDVKNLVRELADNKIWALELVREALSNAKDHGATKAYIRTWRGSRNEVSVVLIDDGEGMTDAGLQAFWGIGASEKAAVSGHPIGYKGHGTKLYFGSERLTVATAIVGSAWRALDPAISRQFTGPQTGERLLGASRAFSLKS